MTFQIKTEEEFLDASHAARNNNQDFWLNISSYYKWQKEPTKAGHCDFKKAEFKWFEDGILNITENCIDRHLLTNPKKTAIIWEGNELEDASKEISYQELSDNVCKAANMLKSIGIKKGDRVCLYMPMIPEAIYAMLAIARIGAVHTVVFAGFSANALAERVNSSKAKLIITADMLYRGNKALNLNDIVNEAIETGKLKTEVLLFQRDKNVRLPKSHKIWQQEIVGKEKFCKAEPMNAEDPFFILYTSGSTGKPKGILHSCAGYMVYAGYSFANVFQPRATDIFWCSADIGWITGHTYSTYGPLLHNLTTVVFEGTPAYPDASRFWQVIEKHCVNIFYTAPTAIRSLMQCGDDFVNKHEMPSLRTLGSVGEPINEEAWKWFYEKVGKSRCEIVDSWWQTETGGIMICNLAHVTKARPTYATKPLPGIECCLLDEEGNEIKEANHTGYLCIKSGWPSMIRSVYGDHQRCLDTYFSRFPGYYFTGDGAFRDASNNYRIIGRVDDVINTSGHRIGTAEVENAINLHKDVSESAVIGIADPIKGEAICAFVIGDEKNTNLKKEINNLVKKQIGSFAKPDHIYITPDLPKTRSGKIMRRILKKLAAGEQDLGDTSTLVNPNIVANLNEKLKNHA